MFGFEPEERTKLTFGLSRDMGLNVLVNESASTTAWSGCVTVVSALPFGGIVLIVPD